MQINAHAQEQLVNTTMLFFYFISNSYEHCFLSIVKFYQSSKTTKPLLQHVESSVFIQSSKA